MRDKGWFMAVGLAILVALMDAGAWLGRVLLVPLPGPLIGMALLAAVLVAWRGTAGGRSPRSHAARVQAGLEQTAGLLIRGMGLLFVPAGAGIVAQGGLLRTAWLPLAAGLVASTLVGLCVTGLVMQHFCLRQAAALAEHRA